MEELESQSKLINSIEGKGKWLRRLQTTFAILSFVALIVIIFIQYQTLTAVQKQLASQQQIVSDIKSNTKTQLDTINRHLDCIVVYFGQPNRSDLTIQDINKCTLQNNTGVQQFFATPQSVSSVAPVVPSSPLAIQPSQKQSTPVTPQSSGSPTNNPPVIRPPVTTPPTVADHKPVSLLGIPLCLAGLVNLCVTN